MKSKRRQTGRGALELEELAGWLVEWERALGMANGVEEELEIVN